MVPFIISNNSDSFTIGSHMHTYIYMILYIYQYLYSTCNYVYTFTFAIDQLFSVFYTFPKHNCRIAFYKSKVNSRDSFKSFHKKNGFLVNNDSSSIITCICRHPPSCNSPIACRLSSVNKLTSSQNLRK